MAIYHLSMKIISRSSGYSAVASAAYRSGSLMLDERTGLTHDYTRKSGVAEAVILTPATAPAWCTNRAELWNAVEKAECRKNSQLAREIHLGPGPGAIIPTMRIGAQQSYERCWQPPV